MKNGHKLRKLKVEISIESTELAYSLTKERIDIMLRAAIISAVAGTGKMIYNMEEQSGEKKSI